MVNPDTQYQNGVDFHFDWGASQFVAKQFRLGLVGYYFQQVTDHTGLGATLGGFRSRVAGYRASNKERPGIAAGHSYLNAL